MIKIKITDSADGLNDGDYVLGPTTQITTASDWHVGVPRPPKTKRHPRRNGLTATVRRRRRAVRGPEHALARFEREFMRALDRTPNSMLVFGDGGR